VQPEVVEPEEVVEAEEVVLVLPELAEEVVPVVGAVLLDLILPRSVGLPRRAQLSLGLPLDLRSQDLGPHSQDRSQDPGPHSLVHSRLP